MFCCTVTCCCRIINDLISTLNLQLVSAATNQLIISLQMQSLATMQSSGDVSKYKAQLF